MKSLNWLLPAVPQAVRDSFPLKLSSFQKVRKEGRGFSRRKLKALIGVPTNQEPPKEQDSRRFRSQPLTRSQNFQLLILGSFLYFMFV